MDENLTRQRNNNSWICNQISCLANVTDLCSMYSFPKAGFQGVVGLAIWDISQIKQQQQQLGAYCGQNRCSAGKRLCESRGEELLHTQTAPLKLKPEAISFP